MYERGKEVNLEASVGVMVKNLQVVSFDSEWLEIYLGTVRRDNFLAVCPNKVKGATTVNVSWNYSESAGSAVAAALDADANEETGLNATIAEGIVSAGEKIKEKSKVPLCATDQSSLEQNANPGCAILTCAKWCPLDNCTILVLGCQFGVQLYDWDGSVLIHSFDFQENGIGVDGKLVTGGLVKGVAALGANYISVGIHTGTILLFRVSTVVTSECPEAAAEATMSSFRCENVDSQRCHVFPITDLASTSTISSESKEVLVSGDESGKINVWCLTNQCLQILKCIEPNSCGGGNLRGQLFSQSTDCKQEFPVTTLSLWNKIGKGIIVAGYGSGLMRIFSVPDGDIVAEVDAHAGWITGMDLASQTGRLVTTAEDGIVRVWQLSTKGHIIHHRFSEAVPDSMLTGVKFLDPKGASFAVSCYDSSRIILYHM